MREPMYTFLLASELYPLNQASVGHSHQPLPRLGFAEQEVLLGNLLGRGAGSGPHCGTKLPGGFPCRGAPPHPTSPELRALSGAALSCALALTDQNGKPFWMSSKIRTCSGRRRACFGEEWGEQSPLSRPPNVCPSLVPCSGVV